jgi:hypothetical protein
LATGVFATGGLLTVKQNRILLSFRARNKSGCKL